MADDFNNQSENFESNIAQEAGSDTLSSSQFLGSNDDWKEASRQSSDTSKSSSSNYLDNVNLSIVDNGRDITGGKPLPGNKSNGEGMIKAEPHNPSGASPDKFGPAKESMKDALPSTDNQKGTPVNVPEGAKPQPQDAPPVRPGDPNPAGGNHPIFAGAQETPDGGISFAARDLGNNTENLANNCGPEKKFALPLNSDSGNVNVSDQQKSIDYYPIAAGLTPGQLPDIIGHTPGGNPGAGAIGRDMAGVAGKNLDYVAGKLTGAKERVLGTSIANDGIFSDSKISLQLDGKMQKIPMTLPGGEKGMTATIKTDGKYVYAAGNGKQWVLGGDASGWKWTRLK